MIAQDIAPLVAPVSPVLASLLAGSQAALALAALGRALVNDDQASPDAIAAAINGGDGNAKLRIQDAEQKLLARTDAAGVAITTLVAQDSAKRVDAYVALQAKAEEDRAGARQRQITLNDKTNMWLAFGITLGFFAVVGLLAAGRVNFGADPGLRASAQTMLGVLGTGWVSVITYYFGSSASSREKTALLAENVSDSTRVKPSTVP
jgi:hypothetical protein